MYCVGVYVYTVCYVHICIRCVLYLCIVKHMYSCVLFVGPVYYFIDQMLDQYLNDVLKH